MRAVVFGGSGFLGSYVADALADAGHEVTVADVQQSRYLRADQRFRQADVTDAVSLRDAVVGCDVVYHFAGIADIDESRSKPVETAAVNVGGTVNLLAAARDAGVSRFVLASTIYVYSESGSFYRVSKQAAELYVEEFHREHGLDYTVLRYGTLYGRRADDRNSVHRYLSQALASRRIRAIATGDEVREYIHCADAARLSVDILDERYANQHVVITGHQRMKFRELLDLIREMIGPDVEIELEAPPDAGDTSAAGLVHYSTTPYHFRPRIAHKLVSSYHVDLGQGLLDCLHELHERDAAHAE